MIAGLCIQTAGEADWKPVDPNQDARRHERERGKRRKSRISCFGQGRLQQGT
jgi:hypothetical protein